MKKLTENLIQQRLKTCTTDLDKVQQINVTGRELQDVSLLKKMTGVEILSLSVNKITTLADFQNCKNLKELYLRNNEISDINQISYLKGLPKLELLMLSQNPCTEDPTYRMTVIKNLKNLSKLDGVAITPEERRQAQKIGKEIVLDEDLIGTTESFASEGSQNQPTPTTQSIQKFKSSEDILNVVNENRNTIETVLENDNEKNEIEVEKPVKISPPLRDRVTKPMMPKDFSHMKLKHTISNDTPGCKFCGNGSSHSMRMIPKNYNILSATLNLLNELDYSGLQIINAEVSSRLSAFEFDLMYNKKYEV